MQSIHAVLTTTLIVASAAPLTAVLSIDRAGHGAEGRDRPRPVAVEDHRRSLLAADSALAAEAGSVGFAAALGGAFADDVVYLQDGLPILRGRDDAAAALAGDPIAPSRVRWTTLRAAVSADGTRGYTFGRIHVASTGAPGGDDQKYLAFWRRAGDGRWRIAAHVRNAGAPAEPSPASKSTSTPAPAPPAPPADDARADALVAADAAFSRRSVERGVADAFGDLAAPDAAVLVGGGGIVYGPDAIREWFAAVPPDAELRWEPRLADIAGSGDLGFTAGTAVFASAAADATTRRAYSKYLTIWQRQGDGSWKYVADAGNRRPAS